MSSMSFYRKINIHFLFLLIFYFFSQLKSYMVIKVFFLFFFSKMLIQSFTSSFSNTSASSSTLSFNPQTLSTPITLKLDHDNFLLWQQQVLVVVRGLQLMHFLEDFTTPPHFLEAIDAITNTVPAFLHHESQDQLLLAWLLASMTAPLLTKMVGVTPHFKSSKG